MSRFTTTGSGAGLVSVAAVLVLGSAVADDSVVDELPVVVIGDFAVVVAEVAVDEAGAVVD